MTKRSFALIPKLIAIISIIAASATATVDASAAMIPMEDPRTPEMQLDAKPDQLQLLPCRKSIPRLHRNAYAKLNGFSRTQCSAARSRTEG
jgi:hypothetical protein